MARTPKRHGRMQRGNRKGVRKEQLASKKDKQILDKAQKEAKSAKEYTDRQTAWRHRSEALVNAGEKIMAVAGIYLEHHLTAHANAEFQKAFEFFIEAGHKEKARLALSMQGIEIKKAEKLVDKAFNASLKKHREAANSFLEKGRRENNSALFTLHFSKAVREYMGIISKTDPRKKRKINGLLRLASNAELECANKLAVIARANPRSHEARIASPATFAKAAEFMFRSGKKTKAKSILLENGFNEEATKIMIEAWREKYP